MTWDVRTNIKAKPGSQGTLFQGGSDQMTDAKWPRGYTPERLKQVRQVVAPRRTMRDMPSLGEQDIAGESRKLIDNIARSTVPREHLQRLQFHPGKSDEEMTSGEGDSQMTAGGHYYKPSSPNPNRFGTIDVRRGDADKPVAIHEIGHHASYLAGRPDLTTPALRGHEEGSADAYAETHFRDRRGQKASLDGYRYKKPDSERNDEFFASYHGARPRKPEFPAYKPQPHLPGLDAVTVYKAGKKRSTS